MFNERQITWTFLGLALTQMYDKLNKKSFV